MDLDTSVQVSSMLVSLYVMDRRPSSLTLVATDNASGDIFLTLRDSRARSGRRQLSQSQRMSVLGLSLLNH